MYLCTYWPDFYIVKVMQESATLIVWKQYTYMRKEYSVMVKSIPTMERLNPTYVIISRIVTSSLQSCGKSGNGQ